MCPLLALPGYPKPGGMGETFPEESGEYSVLYGDSATSHPRLPSGLEPAGSDLCKFSRKHWRGWGSGRRGGTPVSWSVLSLTLSPKEDLAGETKGDTDPREDEERAVS